MTGRAGIPRWMTAERLTAYPAMLIAFYVVALAAWILLADGIIDRNGKPLGTDFISFHAAATLAVDGTPELAYEAKAHHARETAIAGEDVGYYSFSYPPGFLMLLAPFGLLPYPLALLLWLGLTLAALLYVVRQMTPDKAAILLLLAFPATFVTFGHGQNAFLTAALMGAALVTLDKRPWLAGIFIGLLTIKPHLGLLWPLALLAGGHWRTIMAAGVTTIALQGASWLAFGTATWIGFLEGGTLATRVLAEGLVPWSKMQSLYTGLRLVGVPHMAAMVAHGIAAVIAAFAVWQIWRRGAPLGVRAAALVTGALIVTPFVLDYDLMILAPGLLLFALHGREHGFQRREATMVAVLFVWPLVARGVAGATHLGLTPLLLLGFLALLWLQAQNKK
ncbi:glycosyltransferase family 87 protein [Gimibacter soli]|uniref:Glycosyltransferase family 87 protein n=1 Tax=Gimibacter soli TaxID=3024400 RepID=A0AAE9XRP2_9PROT|nr:glycosyltransferase family 87 protein [Gimibacter soli]WCL53695.1 glycosyltransferase family 87 protein [Gimibacter soli]